MAIKNKHILIGRAQQECQALTSALKQLGAVVYHLPLIRIEPMDFAPIDSARYQKIIFVSKNAVNHGLSLLKHYHNEPQLFAVGHSTAELLASNNVPCIVPPESKQHSEGLLALPELQQVQAQHILIVRGVGGRETLKQGLQARGAQVDYAEVYTRKLPHLTEKDWAWAQHKMDYIICTSGQSIKNLYTLAKDEAMLALNDTTIVVPSQRVAEIGYQLGAKSIMVAPGAGDSAIVGALSAPEEHDYDRQRN